MGLKEHQETFSMHSVDGELLSESDDTVLQELGVVSKLQRLRLGLLISGRKSVRDVLEEGASYVQFSASKK